MKFIKSVILAVALLVPFATYAVTDDDSIAFMTAVTEGDTATVIKHLDAGTVSVKDIFFGWSPLLSAAAKGQTAVVKLLAERGADVNYRHPITKMTAVAHASYDGNNELLNVLLDKGADPNIKGRAGVTVLRMATDQNHPDTVKILIAHGAKDDGCQDEQCF
ncbi:MAG: ankyrin repeat domain-containing protein [Methylophilaceae bacterium]